MSEKGGWQEHARQSARRHRRHRQRVWRCLRNCQDAATHRELQAAVSDWLFAMANQLAFATFTAYPGERALTGLWENAELAADVTGLEEATEVFLNRGVELFPVPFLRAVAIALNNAHIVLYGDPVLPPRPEPDEENMVTIRVPADLDEEE